MSDPSNSLPDLLEHNLVVLFVGINPSLYSAAQGHYFARPSNRFWPCFSRSVLSEGARRALGVLMLEPVHDRALPRYGFGFTDVVKRATARASELSPSEFETGVVQLAATLGHYKPRIACFHGVTGYKHVLRAIDPAATPAILGPQKHRIGTTRCFLAPSPSGANAHFTPAEQTGWYDRLAQFVRSPDAL
jgi:TDG/mug DNA glycosylase family protein